MTSLTQDAWANDSAGRQQGVSANQEAIFFHPDGALLNMVHSLDDPVREIAIKFHESGPVLKGHGAGTPRGSQIQFGDVTLPNIFLNADMCEGDVYAAVTWDTVRAVLTRPKLFSSKCFVPSLGRQGPTINIMDPPEHTKFRMVAQPRFMPAYLKKYNTEIIRPSIARRFAELKKKGRADLVRDLTPHMAFEINGTIIGFDPADVPFFATCKKMSYSHDPDAVAKATIAQNDFTRKMIEKRKAEPKDDLISFMIAQEVDGAPVPDINLLGLVNVIMSGGVDTIFKQSGNIVSLLLDHPDELEKLRADRSLIPAFVEESLRYEGVATNFPRQATEDTELGGVTIPKGSIVFGMLFAADRDPSRWENPHVLDAARPPKPNLGFSAGPHSCLGAPIARLVLPCFVEHLIDDLPNLRWDPDQSHPGITGWMQRMVTSLPVIWDARED